MCAASTMNVKLKCDWLEEPSWTLIHFTVKVLATSASSILPSFEPLPYYNSTQTPFPDSSRPSIVNQKHWNRLQLKQRHTDITAMAFWFTPSFNHDLYILLEPETWFYILVMEHYTPTALINVSLEETMQTQGDLCLCFHHQNRRLDISCAVTVKSSEEMPQIWHKVF